MRCWVRSQTNTTQHNYVDVGSDKNVTDGPSDKQRDSRRRKQIITDGKRCKQIRIIEALTGNHLIFRTSAADVALESAFADQIEEGDKLMSWTGSEMTEEAVIAVERVREKSA